MDAQEEPVVVDIYCSANLTGETPAETTYCIDSDEDMALFVEELGDVTEVGGLAFTERATNAAVERTRETSLVRIGVLSLGGDATSTKGLENIVEVDALGIGGSSSPYDLSGLASLTTIRRGMGVEAALGQRELVFPPVLETIGLEEQFDGTGLRIVNNGLLESIDFGQLRAVSWVTITGNRNLERFTRDSTAPLEVRRALSIYTNAALTDLEALIPDVKPEVCTIIENVSLPTCQARRACEGVDPELTFVSDNAPDDGC
jgi:hypothetical protein